MSLRNKLAILSFTLMSLMTIPTRAENDAIPAVSRIENEEFVVDVNPPEGWRITDKYEAIPAAVNFGGSVFHALKFENGTEAQGCVILFTSDSDDEDDDSSLESVLAEAYEWAFPGSSPDSLTLAKIDIGRSVDINFLEKFAKVTLNTAIEGTVVTKSGPSPITAKGIFEVDSKTKFGILTGSLVAGEASVRGATGLIFEDDYQVIIVSWGAEDTTLKNDIITFSKALRITPKLSPPTSKTAE